MSRWLQNVGQFLEKLDAQAGKAAEEQQRIAPTPLLRGVIGPAANEEEEDAAEQENIESILAARGLQSDEIFKDTGREETEMLGDNDDDDNLDSLEETGSEKVQKASASTGKSQASDLAIDSPAVSQSHHETPVNLLTNEEDIQSEIIPDGTIKEESKEDGMLKTPDLGENNRGDSSDEQEVSISLVESNESGADSSNANPVDSQNTVDETETAEVPTKQSAVAASTDASSAAAARDAEALAVEKTKLREATKESRTLRRHILSLNAQLEKAEAEMDAQRRELEQAAVQMEKERAMRKQERDSERQKQVEEIKKLKIQHEAAVQLVRQQLKDMEQQRMREGGDMHDEINEAIQRERDALEKLAAVEDEKETILSQVAILQNQQEALGSRLESLTATADSAMQRERDAEQRLDEALSAHARQISQRQARETALERTIAELGAALVAARSSVAGTAPGLSSSENSTFNGQDEILATATSSSTFSEIQVRQELETLTAQLVHEQQRNAVLYAELQKINKDLTEEGLLAQTRQTHYDRQITELSATIARLKTESEELRRNSMKREALSYHSLSGGDDEDVKQIRALSEEVLRLRERVTSYSSETATLKNRLKTANERAERAEFALEESTQNGGLDASDMERGSSGLGMRRRGAPKSHTRRDVQTIRAALRLDKLQSEKGERIGKTLDALDTFLIESGKFLRYNPVARLLFLVYFLLIHLWTFFLIFFHAHAYGTVHGDFGASANSPHGVSALMQSIITHNVPKAAAVDAETNGT